MDNKCFFEDARVLITGGVGFIGSNLAHKLVELKAKVTVIDSLIPEYGGNLFNISQFEDREKINISDVRDEYSMRYLIREQDYLFNLAGQTSHIDSMLNPFSDLEINAHSQLKILEACRHNNPNIKIIFASTRQIYGKPLYTPVNEKHPISPVDINGVNKLAGEYYHSLYSRNYGIKTVILRLTNTYGPKMRIKDSRQTFLGIWIRNVLDNKPIIIFGDGQQLRDLNYVDDVVEALLLAATSQFENGEVFNLGSYEVISLLELAKRIVKLNNNAKYALQEFPKDLAKIDIGDYYGDFSLANKQLNWTPKISLDEGLLRTLNYFKENYSQYI